MSNALFFAIAVILAISNGVGIWLFDKVLDQIRRVAVIQDKMAEQVKHIEVKLIAYQHEFYASRRTAAAGSKPDSADQTSHHRGGH
jgi:hypothetical protein